MRYVAIAGVRKRKTFAIITYKKIQSAKQALEGCRKSRIFSIRDFNEIENS